MVASAQHHLSGHATSSQSIIRHDIAQNHGYQGQFTQAFPTSYHQAPIVHQVLPIASHGSLQSAAISQHASPIVSLQHVSPVVQRVSPVVQHVSPIHYNQYESGHGHQDYHVS